jgi:uncharacterized protein YdeI (YjbR/CyaY-like superfamily)
MAIRRENEAEPRRAADKLGSLDRVHLRSRVAWRRWLAAHHHVAPGIWLVYDKKSDGRRPLTNDAIVEEALAFGWIDSRGRALSLTQAMVLVTPRKPGSGWSALNKARIARLDAEGRLTRAGLALVEQAKRDGSWEKLTAVQALSMPPDLTRAFKANAAAAKNFAAFPPSSKQIILGWILAAKRSATRQERIDASVRLAAENLRANHWQPKRAGQK